MRSIRDCNVGIIGGGGFIGSHLTEALIEERGCNALVIDNLVAGKREYIHEDASFEWADITGSEGHLLKLFKKYEIDYVFSLAAYPYVPCSFERPLRVAEVNFMGTAKAINAAQEAGVMGILVYSSAEIYGNGAKSKQTEHGLVLQDKITEDAEVHPRSTYGCSKMAIDSFIELRWKEAQTPCIALRQFNCIGQRDMQHPYIVCEVYRQLKAYEGRYANKNWKPDVYLGNNSTRDFMYAGDSARSAIELLEKGQFGEHYNLGSESSIKIYHLAEKIAELMGFEGISIHQDKNRVRPNEIWSLNSCNDKINSVIDYRPTVSFDEALKRTIDYFEDHPKEWGW